MRLLPCEKDSQKFIEIIIVIVCAVVFLVVLAILEQIPIQSIPQHFADSFYSPHYNLMFVNDVCGMNVNVALLYFIVISSMILKVFRKFKKPRSSKAPYQSSFFVSTIVLILLAGIQTINFSRYARVQALAIQNKTLDEKKDLIFGDLYAFSQFCKKMLPGRRAARLVTDMDLTTTTGANKHIALSYNLFPITIQYNPRQTHIMPYYVVYDPFGRTADALIVYQKENPKESVPKDYEIIGQYDQRGLVAVRKK